MDLAIGHIEEVFVSDFLESGDFHERHLSRHVCLFGHPIGDDIVGGRPTEAAQFWDFDRFHVQ